jgi:hypothetical protein
MALRQASAERGGSRGATAGTDRASDAAAPPKLDGTTLTVPVERHNYRLLVIEKR